MKRSIEALKELNLPATDSKTASEKRLSDGRNYRIEIPSTESPETIQAILKEADQIGCPVHRISQGSGIQMLNDAQIRSFAQIGSERNIEVCLFTTPRANFDTGGL